MSLDESVEFDKYHRGPEAHLGDLDKLIESSIQGKGKIVGIENVI